MDTDTSFRDDNPPSNLLSSEERKKRGFLAERFVRPPVSITLNFKTPIFLSHLSFSTVAGQGHQSALYEILVAPYSTDLTNIEFVKVGRTSLMKSTTHKTAVLCTFKNFWFPGNKKNKCSAIVRNCHELSTPVFKLTNVNDVMKGVTHIKIIILKTMGVNSSPSISDLKVYGRVSWLYQEFDIPETVITELYDNWEIVKQKIKSKRVPEDLSTLKFFNSNESEISTNEQLNEKGSEIEKQKDGPPTDPLEFLDSLTSSMMDVPMVLPCGQFIDRKTLDKYVGNEEKFGRKPNDPFTGKPFSNTSYPIFDGKLKARIDEYVLNKNGISIASLREKRKHENKRSDLTYYKKPKRDVSFNDRTQRILPDSHDNRKVNCEENQLDERDITNPITKSQQDIRIYGNNSCNDSPGPSFKNTIKNEPISKVDNIFKTVLSGRKPIINIDSSTKSKSNTSLQRAELNPAKLNTTGTVRTTLQKKNLPIPKKQIKCCKCSHKSNNVTSEITEEQTKPNNFYQIQHCKHIFCRDCIESVFDMDITGIFNQTI